MMEKLTIGGGQNDVPVCRPPDPLKNQKKMRTPPRNAVRTFHEKADTARETLGLKKRKKTGDQKVTR